MSSIPALAEGLCDDAAIFPPGRAPLADAVAAYRARDHEWYRPLAGPLVVSRGVLEDLAGEVPVRAALPVSVTLPGGPRELEAVVAAVTGLPVRLHAVEIAVAAADDIAEALQTVTEHRDGSGDHDVYVEVPRDERADAVLDHLARHGLRAKFRTGGTSAAQFPDVDELAQTIDAAIRRDVPFKLTAGLHRAVRHADDVLGVVQHGFLNVVLATHTLLTGGVVVDAKHHLAERDPRKVADLIASLTIAEVVELRRWFLSFGTCSIREALDDLVGLGLLTAPTPQGVAT